MHAHGLDLSLLDLAQLLQLQQDVARQINQVKENQKKKARQEILALAEKAGIPLADLIGTPAAKGERKHGNTGNKVAPLYRHPEQATLTWTGRGRTPVWLTKLLNEGCKLEDFRIKADADGAQCA